MLQHINVGHKKLSDYSSLAGRRLMDQIQRLAEPLAGKRVLHLSAAADDAATGTAEHHLRPDAPGDEVRDALVRGLVGRGNENQQEIRHRARQAAFDAIERVIDGGVDRQVHRYGRCPLHERCRDAPVRTRRL